MSDEGIFADEQWEAIAGQIEKLPRPVKLVVWGNRNRDGRRVEQEAWHLAHSLAERFTVLHCEHRTPVPDYSFYPLIGVMGLEEETEVDFRVRFIGLPAGYQLSALVGAIQAVSFRASNLEARTRIQLNRMPEGSQIDLEVFTAAGDEAGPLVGTLAAGLAVASPRVRAFVVMTDLFPRAAVRYSIRELPHTVINGRVHVAGIVDEEEMLRQIGRIFR